MKRSPNFYSSSEQRSSEPGRVKKAIGRIAAIAALAGALGGGIYAANSASKASAEHHRQEQAALEQVIEPQM